MNKLFCSFSPKDRLSETINQITSYYTVVYNKIFVLESPESEEYLCTYNTDPVNSGIATLPNTILLHRKKETNTLYTINSLNALIRSLNNGILDSAYPINWVEYRNCALLTSGTNFRKLNTTVYKIITL